MVLLKQGISSSPFFILGIMLLGVGFANILYNLYRSTTAGKKRKKADGDQIRASRKMNILFIIIVIAIITGMVLMIKWLSTIKSF